MHRIFAILWIGLTVQLSGAVYLAPSLQFKPRIEIAVVYIESNNHILLLHRQDHKAHGNHWCIPGGKVDKNESALQAAIREVKEETGYDISGQSIDYVGKVYVEHNEVDHFVHHMFRTRLQGDPGAVQINFCEHKGFTWVTPTDSLKMELMQDEDPCIRFAYFPESVLKPAN